MPAEQSPADLGGWAPSELGATVQQFAGVGSDYDIDETIRFVRGVATVIRKREAVDQEGGDPKKLSVFLLFPESAGIADLPREPMLDAGQTRLAGYIWLVNSPVVAGRARKLEVDDADGVFRTVTDELQLGSVPTIVVDPRSPKTELRYYPRGLDLPDECAPVRFHYEDINLGKVCNVIERVYRQCLITPSAQPQAVSLWKDPSKHWPHRSAEHRVQALLKSAFAAEFVTTKVYHEFAGVMGRADLHLAGQDPLDPASWDYLAVLELKVLRSYSDEGATYSASRIEEAIAEGVRQAGAYREEHGYRVATLCCFDMRDVDSGEVSFETVRQLAETARVALRRWYLYASTEQAREARFS